MRQGQASTSASVRCLTDDLNIFLNTLPTLNVLTEIDDAFTRFLEPHLEDHSIWNKQKSGFCKAIDDILNQEETKDSLIPFIRKFYDAWRQNKVLCADEGSFKRASGYYRNLVCIEFYRAVHRMRIDDGVFQKSLKDLCDLAFFAPIEIKMPFHVVAALLDLIKEDSAQKRSLEANSEMTILFSKTLRAYVDLIVHQRVESVEREVAPKTFATWSTDVFQSGVANLSAFIGRQFFTQKLLPFKYEAKDVSDWQSRIEIFLKKVKIERVGLTAYHIIAYELTQAVQGLSAIPQRGQITNVLSGLSISASVVGGAKLAFQLLYKAYQFSSRSTDKHYFDVLGYRFSSSIICQASEDEQQEAQLLLSDLQEGLKKAVNENNDILSHALLDLLGGVAQLALLREVSYQAFFGVENGLGIIHFIHEDYKSHDHLSKLYYVALEIFRNMVMNVQHKFFSAFLEKIKQHVYLLDVIHSFILNEEIHEDQEQSCKNEVEVLLEEYLEKGLYEIREKAVSKEILEKNQLLVSIRRVVYVQDRRLWNQWAQSEDSSRGVHRREFYKNLQLFFEVVLEDGELGPEEQARYRAAILLIYLYTAEIAEGTSPRGEQIQRLLIDLAQENLLDILRSILKQFFQLRDLRVAIDPEMIINLATTLRGIPSAFQFFCRHFSGAVSFSQDLSPVVQQQIAGSEYENDVLWKSLVQGHNDHQARSSLSRYRNGEHQSLGLLSQDVLELLDEQGNLKRKYPASKHNVNALPGGSLHLKERPELPGYEIAANIFYRHLAGVWNESELVWFCSDDGRSYPVLISKTISGETLGDFFVNTVQMTDQIKLKNFKRSFDWLVIFSLLMRLGDGKDSNFIVGPEGHIYFFDQEELFCSAFLKEEIVQEIEKIPQEDGEKNNRKILYKVGIKNILFCMNEMNHQLESDFVESFLNLSPETILQNSFADLAEYSRHLDSSFISEMKKNYEEKIKEIKKAKDNQRKKELIDAFNESLVTVEIPPDFIATFCENFLTLQTYLRQAQATKRKVTSWHLFNKVDPALCALYQRVCEEHLAKTPLERFDEIVKGHYNVVIVEEDNPLAIEAEDPDSASSVASTESSLAAVGSTSTPKAIKSYKSLKTVGALLRLQRSEDAGSWLSPEEACASLKIYMSIFDQAQTIQKDLQRGGFRSLENFLNLGVHSREQLQTVPFIFKHLDFSGLGDKKEQELIKKLLKILGKRSFESLRHLSLCGSKTLTDAQFSKLVNHFPKLGWVCLNDCALLGGRSVNALSEHCLDLMVLQLERLPSLQKISYTFSYVPYPQLVKFSAYRCGSLGSIYLNAPQLGHVDVSNNQNIRIVQTKSTHLSSLNMAGSSLIGAAHFHSLALRWKNLVRLDVSDCRLRLDSLRNFSIIKNNLLQVRMRGACPGEYKHYLNYPDMAEYLSIDELEKIFFEIVRHQLFLYEHLREMITHWLCRFLLEKPAFQSQFLNYIFGRYPFGSAKQDGIHKWICWGIQHGLFSVLDFSGIAPLMSSCSDFDVFPTQEPGGQKIFFLNESWVVITKNDREKKQIVVAIFDILTKQIRSQFFLPKFVEAGYPVKWRFSPQDESVSVVIFLSQGKFVLGTTFGRIAKINWHTGQVSIFLPYCMKSVGIDSMYTVQAGPADGVTRTRTDYHHEYASIKHLMFSHDQSFLFIVKPVSAHEASYGHFVQNNVDVFDFHNRHHIMSISHAYDVVNLITGHFATALPHGIIKIWDIDTKKSVATLGNRVTGLFKDREISTLLGLPDGRLMSAHKDFTVRLWDLTSNNLISSLKLSVVISNVTLLPSGLCAMASNQSCYIWDFTSQDVIPLCENIISGSEEIQSLSVLSDGQLLIISNKSNVFVSRFKKAIKHEYAQGIADALILSSSVTTLNGAEFIEDQDLRNLIEKRIARNRLFHERHAQDPDYTLEDAAEEVRNIEAVSQLAGSTLEPASSVHGERDAASLAPARKVGFLGTHEHSSSSAAELLPGAVVARDFDENSREKGKERRFY